MRLTNHLGFVAALLVFPVGLCMGMGSGPHPHLLYGIPQPVKATSQTTEGSFSSRSSNIVTGILLSTVAAGIALGLTVRKQRT